MGEVGGGESFELVDHAQTALECGHHEEEQIREPFDVVAIRQAVVPQDLEVIPVFFEEGERGY